MKKQIITKQDIQRDLLDKIEKAKGISLFLTIFIAVGILYYIFLILNYNDIMVEYTSGVIAGRRLHPNFQLFVFPIVILFFTLFLLDFYYIDLFRAKKGRFTIIEEELYQKKKEYISYYRRIEKENLLYFRCGRVSVEKEAYYGSKVGDRFYVVVLRSGKAPRLVYNTRYYKLKICS